MKKIIITTLVSIMLSSSVSAGTDGENNISKSKNLSKIVLKV